MENIIGRNIKAFKGSARLIWTKDNEALVLEKYQKEVSIFICTIENSVIQTSIQFDGIPQAKVIEFLAPTPKGQSLIQGIRIGPMFRGKHVRHIVLLRNQQKDQAGTWLVKVEPISRQDEQEWHYNESGWVSIANLGHKASGLIVFIRNIPEEDIIPISQDLTKEGVFFLKPEYEIYIENVMKSYAFGKLVPLGGYNGYAKTDSTAAQIS